MTNSQKILILGVTSGGKWKLAFELAKKLDGEIISIDTFLNLTADAGMIGINVGIPAPVAYLPFGEMKASQ